MRTDRIVIDASSLIVLFRAGLDRLLPDLFDDIIVPSAVWQEIVCKGHKDVSASALRKAKWAKKTEVRISSLIAAWDLGQGESQVLTFALEHSGYRAVLDDTAARKCAAATNIPFLGTGGMLIIAKRRGLIASVSDALADLQKAGLWLSPKISPCLKNRQMNIEDERLLTCIGCSMFSVPCFHGRLKQGLKTFPNIQFIVTTPSSAGAEHC